MRRKGHPSRPRAMTCCFFASLKTLLIPTKATALRRNQRPRASFSLAGFQVTLIGRFWVTAEASPPVVHSATKLQRNCDEPNHFHKSTAQRLLRGWRDDLGAA